MSPDAPPSRRIVSLDQFRGYTIAGMFLVNFVGGFAVSPFLFKHHYTFCSYADTIMPHFLFAVGFALRLSFGRRELTQGAGAAYGRIVRRLLGLFLVGLFIFQFDGRLNPSYWFELVGNRAWGEIWRPFSKSSMQTLFQIAAATLWVVPVIRASARWRIVWLLGSALLHVGLNHAFYFAWMYEPGQGHTGGPLGFLTWCIPTLVGTLACDAVVNAPGLARLAKVFVAACALMALGYLLSCGTRWYDVPTNAADKSDQVAGHPVIPPREAFDAWRSNLAEANWKAVLAEPPFFAPPPAEHRQWNYWMMSVKPATLSFMTFNAGFSLFVYLVFYLACDIGGAQLGLFRTLGRNALAGYLLQWPTDEIFTDLVEQSATKWGTACGFPAEAVGRNAPAIFVLAGFVAFFFVNWLILRWMEKRQIFLKV